MITINGTKLVTETFPNGETKLDLAWLFEEVLIDIKWKYESDSEIVLLRFISDYLKKADYLWIDLTIVYMPYSRMDRSENGSVFTLQSVTRMINEMHFTNVYVFEPHSNKTEELIVNCTAVNITEKLLKDALSKRDDDNFIVFYPDAGAKGRYNMNEYPSVTGSKKRDFNTGEIISYEIDAHDVNIDGRDVYIIDDLCSYGGTFIKASKKLRELGANHITLVVAHAETSIMKGELFEHVNEVYTTNSIISQNHLFKFDKNSKAEKTTYPINIKEII